MTCPAGRVKVSDQPLTAAAPVLVMVRFSVSPVFQAETTAFTLQAPFEGGVVVCGVVVGGVVVGGVVFGGVVVGGVVVGGVVVGGVVVNWVKKLQTSAGT